MHCLLKYWCTKITGRVIVSNYPCGKKLEEKNILVRHKCNTFGSEPYIVDNSYTHKNNMEPFQKTSMIGRGGKVLNGFVTELIPDELKSLNALSKQLIYLMCVHCSC